MRVLPKIGMATGPLFVLLAVGCQATVDTDHSMSSGAGASGGSTASPGGGSGNLAGSVALPPGSDAAALLPARIRRLTVSEYQATVSDPTLIGSAADGVSADFVPDSRQNGFTVNAAQRVDPVFAAQLAEAATKLAANVREHAAERAPCADTAAQHDQCAETFIRSFGAKAYRRPLAEDEVSQLLGLFRVAFDGGSYEEGIELVARAVLQSASFLYHTEIGEAPAATVKLTPYELASSISYLVQGGPPSAALVDLAKSGALETPEGRAELLTDPNVKLFDNAAATSRVSRMIREWLGIDRVADIAKDSTAYGDFEGARAAIAAESGEFVKALLAQDHSGSLRELLAADWTMANQQLGAVYGGAPQGSNFQRFTPAAPARRGILNQGAFLSVFAHAQETAPVLRGVAVMRRLVCLPLPDPSTLGLSVVPPLPDKTKTVRERFAIHAETPGCSGCHNAIDNFGFAFEQFNGMGKYEPGLDSSVVISGTDFDGSYASSNELAVALSTSSQVRQCFARQMFRALSATSDAALKPSEDDFVKYWDTTLTREGDEVKDVYIIGTIGAFLTNPAFDLRRAQ